jgi:hypothetical protein
MGPKHNGHPYARSINEALMDAKVRELALISVIACVGFALAWAHETDFFAICFATAAAIAIVEAAR